MDGPGEFEVTASSIEAYARSLVRSGVDASSRAGTVVRDGREGVVDGDEREGPAAGDPVYTLADLKSIP